MMTARSDIEHWQINATVYKDRVEEIHYITDPARSIRRRPQTKVWKVERFLGRGGFGEVRLEKSTEDGKVRAVKRIPIAKANLSIEECERELKALLEFSKPKYREAAVFVDFFGWFKDGSSDVFLAMEYVPLGDLETNVTAHSGKIPEIEARDITQQILSGLEIMHAESFAHRDLKPQNILVVHGPPQWWVKLADFGLSKRLSETTAYHTKSGTQSYMAPEILDYLDTDTPSTEYTNAVDLWAVGCIIYRLVTGVVPFQPGRSLIKYCEDKALFPFGPLFDSGIKRPCFEFIKGLLEACPKERPSASQALNHTWVISGSNTRTRSDLSPLNQDICGLSELAISNIDYNTVSHDGLKSNSLHLASHTDSSYTESSLQIRSASHPNLSTISNHFTGTRKRLPTSDSKLVARQISIEEDITPPALKSDVSTNQLSTQEPLAMAQLVPNIPSSSLDDKTVSLLPDAKVVASPSKEKSTSWWRPHRLTRQSGSETQKTGTSVQILKGHTGSVWSVAFSPDGKVVASTSDDNTIRLWDAATGGAIQSLRGHTRAVYSVTFSPSGEVLASASNDKIIQLWDVATGAVLEILSGHKSAVFSVVFSPNGKVVASASKDKTVRLWDVATGATLQTLNEHTNWVMSVAFSPDGKIGASASYDTTVRLWDTATGAPLRIFHTNPSAATSVTFSPDGKVVAFSSSDGTIKLWDPATGKALLTLKGQTGSVICLTFSPNGKVVACASSDKKVRLWDAATGAAMQILTGHTSGVQSVAFSPDGKVVASASRDKTVRLWDEITELPHN